MSEPIRDIRIFEIMEAKDFSKMEIGQIIQYLDEKNRKAAKEVAQEVVKPLIDRIDKLDRLFWRTFLLLVAILVGVAPEAVSNYIGLFSK